MLGRDGLAAGLLLLPLLADGLLWISFGREWTITARVEEWADRWPLLPWLTLLAMALLWWHWFGDRYRTR